MDSAENKVPDAESQNENTSEVKPEESKKNKRKSYYDDDDTINEDMRAGNPIGFAENEEEHWIGRKAKKGK